MTYEPGERQARPDPSSVMSTPLRNVFSESDIEAFEKLIERDIDAVTIGALIGDLLNLAAERGQKMSLMADDNTQLAEELSIYEKRMQPQLDALNDTLTGARRSAEVYEKMFEASRDKMRSMAMVIAMNEIERLNRLDGDIMSSIFDSVYGSEVPNEDRA